MLPSLVGGISLASAATLAPEAIRDQVLSDIVRPMETKTPSIDQSRELLGLLIVAGWMLVLTVRGLRRR